MRVGYWRQTRSLVWASINWQTLGKGSLFPLMDFSVNWDAIRPDPMQQSQAKTVSVCDCQDSSNGLSWHKVITNCLVHLTPNNALISLLLQDIATDRCAFSDSLIHCQILHVGRCNSIVSLHKLVTRSMPACNWQALGTKRLWLHTSIKARSQLLKRWHKANLTWNTLCFECFQLATPNGSPF